MSDHTDDQFSDEEAAQRRDAVVRRMAQTPPKPRGKGRPPSLLTANVLEIDRLGVKLPLKPRSA
jgi:hypothetical protein